MNESEVAREMQHIEEVCNAMKLGLNGFAQVAPHYVVKRRYKALDNHHTRLTKLVGEDKATEMLCDTYNRIVK